MARSLVCGLPASPVRSAFLDYFHFISKDRQHGGHLLDCAAAKLQLRMEALADFHLALPETESFLKADFSKNKPEELAYAEHAH